MDAVGLKALDEGFSFLDRLPAGLIGPTIGSTGGTLRERVEAVASLREALLEGRLPGSPLLWPPPPGPVRLMQVLADLGMPRYCNGRPELADQVILSILDAVSDSHPEAEATFIEELRRLESLERLKAEESAKESPKTKRPRAGGRVNGGGQETDPEISDEIRAAIAARAQEAAARQQAETAGAAVETRWRELVRLWASMEEVFGELGSHLGLGWDLSLGVLQTTGWTELLRLRTLVEKLGPLRDLVRTLGRLRTSTTEPDEVGIETVIERVRRATEIEQETRSPLVPGETRGITRSDEISRMLPSEAVLLGHPVLKMLWHARRAEQALTTYLVEGVWTDRVSMEGKVEVRAEKEVRRPHAERGPILVCLDTSGSMSGLPEQVAKAIVLEALRVAHAEGRACYLYSFSGPGQVVEHDLSLSPGGLARLLEFLLLSFGGGTDIEAPITRALDRLNSEEWKRADILLLTDGEFPASGKVFEAVRESRERLGVRVQGVLIGNRSSPAMDALCDHVAPFTDWSVVVR